MASFRPFCIADIPRVPQKLLQVLAAARRLLLRNVAAALVISLSQAAYSQSNLEASEFSDGSEFALQSSCASDGSYFCVIGNVPVGKAVILLGKIESRICKTSSVANEVLVNEGSGKEINITRVSAIPCKGFKFDLAYVSEKNINYRVEELPEVKDAKLAQRIDESIRDQRETIETTSGEHPIKLGADHAKIVAFPGQHRESYLAIFENISPAKDEVHVFYSNGRAEVIHGAAKIASVFRIDKKTFLHYRFNCHIGCGWRGDFVIEIGESTFKSIFFDDSSST